MPVPLFNLPILGITIKFLFCSLKRDTFLLYCNRNQKPVPLIPVDKSKTDNNDAIHSIEQEVIKYHQIIEEAKKRIE